MRMMKTLALIIVLILFTSESMAGAGSGDLFRAMERQMEQMKFKMRLQNATHNPMDFGRTDDQQMDFERSFVPDSFLGYHFGEVCLTSKWVVLSKPFRGFSKVYLKNSDMGRLWHIELQQDVSGCAFDSVCEEVKKVAGLIAQKFKITLKRLYADDSCYQFTNDKSFINVQCITVNDKPTTILVVVNNLDVSSVDEKLKRAENRKGIQMTSRPDQDGADLL